jgi:hypothetical protein
MSLRSRYKPALSLVELAVLVAGMALYLGLTSYQLHLPGPHYDEAIEVLPTMQFLLGQPVEAFRGAGLHIGSLFLPLMTMDYIGAMNTYLALPFLALLGVTVPAMRLMPILFSAITLLLTYALARDLFGRAGAAIAYLTLAGSVSFVFWSRQGIFVTNLTATLMMGALVCALRWRRSGRRRCLWAAAFLLGLGLYTKFIFLWAIGALAGSVILLYADQWVAWARRRAGRPWPALSQHDALGAVAAFLLPLVPLIIFNLQTGGTLRALTANMRQSYYGVNNLAFWENLQTRADQLRSVLEGSHFWYLGETFANQLWPPALAGALALLIAVALWRRRTIGDAWRAALFPFAMIGIILLESCFTISALWYTHFAILTPLPPLALAGALTFIARQSGKARLLAPAMVVLVAGLIAYDVQADVRYHTVLQASGGYAAHSDASYELARVLQREAAGPVVALDWGIQAQTQYLTAGQIAPQEVFGYDDLAQPDAGFAARLAPYLRDSRTLYVAHPSDQEVYRGRALSFNRIAEQAGKTVRIYHIIYERSGRPAYIVLKAD